MTDDRQRLPDGTIVNEGSVIPPMDPELVPATHLHALTPPPIRSDTSLSRSARDRALRGSLWSVAVILMLCGWFLVGATVVSGGDGWLRLCAGLVALVAGVALTLRLRGKRSVLWVVVSTLCAAVAAPFAVIGLILFVIYPLAAALRGM